MNLNHGMLRRLERTRFGARDAMSAMLSFLGWSSRMRSGQDGAPDMAALHPPRRFRVYADLIFPLPDAESAPVVRPAAPARKDGEGR
jgi:hypothetical protein